MFRCYDDMPHFEVGKTYAVNSVTPMTVTVTKRSEHYVWVSGDVSGRFYAYRDDFFKLGEEIMIPVNDGTDHKMFCFAGKVRK